MFDPWARFALKHGEEKPLQPTSIVGASLSLGAPFVCGSKGQPKGKP